MNNRNKKLISWWSIIIIVIVLSVSYAVFSYIGTGTKNNTLNTGTLVLSLDETSAAGISLANSIPISDTEGTALTAYTFELKNTGSIASNYRIMLVEDTDKYTSDGCTENKLPLDNLKFSLTKNSETPVVDILNATTPILETGILAANTTNTYALRIWIKDSATTEINGKHFHGKLKIDAIAEGQTNYDTGA